MPLQTYGIELSFIPRKGKLKEYSGEIGAKTALKMASRFNTAMNRMDKIWSKKNGIDYLPFILTAKADTFRGGGNGLPNSLHIELNNRVDGLICEGDWNRIAFKDYLKEIFKVGKSLGLTTKFTRGNKYWPTGGFHVHLGMNLFADDGQFLDKLNKFNQSIWADYCNRPYIKWLMDEFFDHHNSYIGVNHIDLHQLDSHNISIMDLQTSKHAIQPRWQTGLKKTMPTLEFRFFDSPRNPKELVENLDFISAWVGFHINRVNEGRITEFSLTKEKLNGFTKLRQTWKEIAEFLTLLGLNPKNYRGRFDSNYRNRVKMGLFKQK